MSEKHRCSQTGIEYEGSILPEELGIVPTEEERIEAELGEIMGPERRDFDPMDPLPSRREPVQKDGVTYHVDPLAETSSTGVGVGTHLMPSEPDYVGKNGMLTLTNKTMEGVRTEQRQQVFEHQCAVESLKRQMRFDPVTKTLY